jgi:hypothetical protein
MKTIINTFLAIAVFAVTATGQTPNSFKYQTIVRDANGEIVVNQEVTITLSILQGSANGNVVCSESFAATTNDFGLVNLEVGSLDPTAFSAIDWANGPYFIKVELDGNVMGTSQLLSVPYALYAERTNLNYEAGDGIQINGNVISTDIGLSVSSTGDTLYLVPGNYVIIPGISTANAGEPVVTTNVITTITSNSAICGYTVTIFNGPSITARGVCWDTSINPTIAGFHTNDGSGNGTFNTEISGLVPNTPYYIRAYATNSYGTFYGNEMIFTTSPTLPIIITSNVTNITENSAICGGTVIYESGSNVIARGVCWSTSQPPTVNDSYTMDGTGIGEFISTITGLNAGTNYYIAAYATNNVGTNYGEQKSFTTIESLPTVFTGDVGGITAVSAIAIGNVISEGSNPVSERGICWGISPNPNIYFNKIPNGSGLGEYNVPINILVPNLTYHVRAYATSNAGTSYGDNKTFTTQNAYYEGFENGFPTSTGWAGVWSITTDNPLEGYYSLVSPTPGDTLVFNHTFNNPGQISFYYRGGCYYLSYCHTAFYIDNVEVGVYSDCGWTIHSASVAPGTHVFKWRNLGSGGPDDAHLDYIICTE